MIDTILVAINIEICKRTVTDFAKGAGQGSQGNCWGFQGEGGGCWMLETDLAKMSLCHRWDLSFALIAEGTGWWDIVKENMNILSETWILPFIVLFAMVVYAVLAIVFYNNEGWSHYNFEISGIWRTLNVINVVTVQCFPLSIFDILGVNWCCIILNLSIRTSYQNDKKITRFHH